MSKYGDINDDTKLFLNLCYVDNNHYNILYEKKGDKFNNKKTLKIEDIEKIKYDNIKFQKDLEIKLEYVKDKRTISYEDIAIYFISKEKTGYGIYPNYIYKI